MPLNPIGPYTAEARTLHDDYSEAVRQLALRMRKEVVIPFCDKYGLRFHCGMGEYAFSEADGSHGDHGDWERHEESSHMWSTSMRPTDKAPPGYDKVFNALNTEVPDNMGYNLFLFIGDYIPEDADG